MRVVSVRGRDRGCAPWFYDRIPAAFPALHLTRKWQRELDYSLRKSLWDFHEDRIAVRFQYECRDGSGQWYRSYGNELWEFAPSGLMARREASINDVPIDESERRYFGRRPACEHGLDIPLW
ncbi:DUF1348 family protein [Candidatus Mycobacterium methanotrophicum]|uniref:Nuclear transport factor 2 family protein n=1 Tax=Candidatus Mycobacterium methanotrophicum TaxID=2943498 RepID=A0ABY4QIP4_9MYCO|nr:DUF1348 family protein [Candidatus Mycobacterium methanotrophicum]UQX10902.1 nuclear transport factor 2 family protein [Candidatus Mycobacterium methanotrophicum]